MSSGCDECRELADSCVTICRELEWLISRQKLEAMRHNFPVLNSFDADIDRLNRKTAGPNITNSSTSETSFRAQPSLKLELILHRQIISALTGAGRESAIR